MAEAKSRKIQCDPAQQLKFWISTAVVSQGPPAELMSIGAYFARTIVNVRPYREPSTYDGNGGQNFRR